MLPLLTGAEGVGNASSVHRFGRRLAAAVDEAREHVAALVGGRASGVAFTSGATEANNLALRGVVEAAANHASATAAGDKLRVSGRDRLRAAAGSRPRMLVSAVEHASVARTARWLHDRGLVESEVVGVTAGGFVEPDAVDGLLDGDVLLVSVMAANSETGVLNPVGEIAERVRAAGTGVILHCDATQMAGRLPFDMESSGVDLVSISGHKICGPGGVGALIGTRRALRGLEPLLHGGGHERGLRPGSLNVAGAVGFGIAARIAAEEREAETVRVGALRDRLVEGLSRRLEGVHQNGDTTRRLPNTANVRFTEADAEAVMIAMDPVAVSTGSACDSGAVEPSRVLTAMGLSGEAAFESIRFSLGRFTTETDIDTAIDSAVRAVEHVRSMGI